MRISSNAPRKILFSCLTAAFLTACGSDDSPEGESTTTTEGAAEAGATATDGNATTSTSTTSSNTTSSSTTTTTTTTTTGTSSSTTDATTSTSSTGSTTDMTSSSGTATESGTETETTGDMTMDGTGTGTGDDATDTTGDVCEDPNIVCGDDEECIDPQTDETYCGASGNCMGDNIGVTCRDDQSCTEGACTCSGSTIECEGSCIDPQTDDDFCGAKDSCAGDDVGVKCGDAQSCVEGACECDVEGQVLCDGKCIDPMTDNMQCGADAACQGGTNCTDDGKICNQGVCSVDCGELVNCNDTCIDPQTDEDHCGASNMCTGDDAGQACGDDQTCEAGVCTDIPCTPNRVTLSGTLNSSEGDFNFADGTADIDLHHKQDVDVDEDGCITAIDLIINKGKTGSRLGCQLELRAEKVLNERKMLVTSVKFTGDSQCAGINDESEGVYENRESSNSWIELGQLEVDEDNVSETCIKSTLKIELDVKLDEVARRGGDRELTFDGGMIQIEGDLGSDGDDTNTCPGVACNPLDSTGLKDCGAAEGCYPDSLDVSQFSSFSCLEKGSGEQEDSCSSVNDCDAGLTCIEAADTDGLCESDCCIQICSVSNDNCPEDQYCRRVHHFNDTNVGICVGT